MVRRMKLQIAAVLAVIVGGVLWLLSVVAPEAFSWFNFALFVAVVAFGWGGTLLVDALTTKGEVPVKKAKIILGIILMVLAAVCVYWGIAITAELIFPLVVIIIACGSLIAIFALKGEKWDRGDNEVAGYKTYRERKAEEEKAKEETEEEKED